MLRRLDPWMLATALALGIAGATWLEAYDVPVLDRLGIATLYCAQSFVLIFSVRKT